MPVAPLRFPDGWLMSERGFDSQSGVEVGQDGATVRELFGPKPKMGRGQTSMAPALLPEKDSGGKRTRGINWRTRRAMMTGRRANS